MSLLNENKKNDLILNFLIEDKFRCIRHIVFLTMFLVFVFNGKYIEHYGEALGYYVALSVYFTFISMFYLNIYVLVPKFLFKSKHLKYFILLLILAYIGAIILQYLKQLYLEYYFLNNHSQSIDWNYQQKIIKKDIIDLIVVYASMISVSTTIQLLQRWIRDSKRLHELKTLTFEMELIELKNQISPHFLFNMLNNVKALIRINPEKASIVVSQLSEFLRYQLYENSKEKVLLSSEIDFMRNLLKLEQIRKDNFEFELNINIDTNYLSSIILPPSLFTVFIENAIKHSVSENEYDKIVKIQFFISENKLHFICENSLDKDSKIKSNKNNGGLGLVNIKRRLELIYGEEYTLDISSTSNNYLVKLSIPI